MTRMEKIFYGLCALVCVLILAGAVLSSTPSRGCSQGWCPDISCMSSAQCPNGCVCFRKGGEVTGSCASIE